MKRLPCLVCSVNITFTKTKRGMSLIYGTSTILFALNIFPFHHGLLLWSPSHKSSYGHSPDNVSGFLFWQFLSFSKITMCAFIVIAFIVIGSSAKFCHGSTFVLLFANTTFYQIYHHLNITIKFFLHLINFVWIYTFKSTCIFHVTA